MAGPVVITGAMAMCTMGTAPSTLNFIPAPVIIGPTQAGKITDIVPMLNIPSFGMCLSLANPIVVAATAAKFGVLTPMPCIPAPVGPWAPGSSSVLLGGAPILDQASVLNCNFAGTIMITFAGQVASNCVQ